MRTAKEIWRSPGSGIELIKTGQREALEAAVEECHDHQCSSGRDGCVLAYGGGATCSSEIAKAIRALTPTVPE